jgi:hypothetical protein
MQRGLKVAREVLGLAAFVAATVVAAAARSAASAASAAGGRVPLRGLGLMLALGSAAGLLLWYAGRWQALDSAPYLYGAAAGILTWIVLLLAATSFAPERFTVEHDLGIAVFLSLVVLPLLAAGLLAGANIALDRAPPHERASTLLEDGPEAKEGLPRLMTLSVLSWKRAEQPLELSVRPDRFRGARQGASVRVVTGRGFFGWEYLIEAMPLAIEPQAPPIR